MRVLKLLHGWLGAISALFVILIAGSGVLLAFMSEFFLAEYGDVLRAQPPTPNAAYADLDTLIDGATRGYGAPFVVAGVLMPHSRVPGVQTAMVYGLPEGEDDFEQLRMLSVDPWSGAFKGDFRLDDAFGHQLIHFHHQLFAGDVGNTLVSALGVLLVLFALSGLWIWWPRTGSAWSKAKHVNLKGAAKWVLLSVHGWAGVWLSLLIVMFALTGTAVSSPGWFGGLLAPAPDAPPASANFAEQCSARVSAGDAGALVAAAFPDRRITGVTFDAQPNAPYRYTLSSPADLDTMHGDVVVFAHPTCTGRLYAADLSEGGWSQLANQLMFPLHGGYAFGPVLGDVLVILSGLALLLLAGSGVYVFVTHTLALQRKRTRALAPMPREAAPLS